MGDRTTLYLNYAECDREAVEGLLGEPETEDTEGGIVNAMFDQVNCGGIDELVDLARKGVPCYGRHDEGYEYRMAYVAAVRKRYDECVVGCMDDSVCVDYDLATGKVKGLASAKRFRRHWLASVAAVAKRAGETLKETACKLTKRR